MAAVVVVVVELLELELLEESASVPGCVSCSEFAWRWLTAWFGGVGSFRFSAADRAENHADSQVDVGSALKLLLLRGKAKTFVRERDSSAGV